jgi:hypothetical protein
MKSDEENEINETLEQLMLLQSELRALIYQLKSVIEKTQTTD